MRELAYRYRVSRRPATARNRWQLSVVQPNGKASRMTTYATLRQAVSAARVLAGWRGEVEVRP